MAVRQDLMNWVSYFTPVYLDNMVRKVLGLKISVCMGCTPPTHTFFQGVLLLLLRQIGDQDPADHGTLVGGGKFDQQAFAVDVIVAPVSG